MQATGLIVEYNPFHNGHIYHLTKAKELTKPDVLVAVMSGNWTQRGTPAVTNKWERAKIAVTYGVDLVLELPYINAVQNADRFALGAVSILDLAKVSAIVFGSECGNLEALKEISEISFDPNHFKENLDAGYSYPASYDQFSSRYGPNDILGVAYLKALKETNIKPYVIKREVNYFDSNINKISSAYAIRQAIREHKDISETTPMNYLTKIPQWEDYYPLLRYILLTTPSSELHERFLVSEGIENLFIKEAIRNDSYSGFISACTTRRYTTSRIQRTLVHILSGTTTKEKNELPKLDYLRVLAYNQKGQEYLHELRNKKIQIANKFIQIPLPYRDLEYKATLAYAFPQTMREQLIQQEIYGQFR